MICKKGTKERNKKKVNSVNVENCKQLITRRTTRLIAQSSISGAKQTRIDPKSVGSKQNKSALNKKIKDKKSEKTSQTIKSKVKKCAKKERKNSYNNKSNKSKIKKIKEIAKKVKTKTCNKVKEVVKRKLRNNCKIDFETEETKMKNINNTSNRNKNSKQSLDKMVWNYDNEKLSLKNVCQNSSKSNSASNLCTKLFPTLNCVKALNSSKSFNKSEKLENSDSKPKPKLRTNLKIDTKNTTKQKESEKTFSNTKLKPKTKTNKIRKSVNTKKKCNSSSKPKNKTMKNRTEKVKQNNCFNNIKSTKPKNKSNKSDNKSSDKEKQNKLSVGRGHRLASLNAIAKVRLLCENEKNDSIEDRSDDSISRHNLKLDKSDRKSWSKSKDKKRGNDCKALVVVDNSRKQLTVRKRKTIDDSIEIIDTRSCKRMASLNASAIMAASYLPERAKRSKSVESNHSSSSVEMVREMQTISQTVSRFEISPSVNGLHVNHMNQVSHQSNGVILAAQKHETIETVKQLKVSNKIKDRLLGIAKLERNQRARQKRKENKNQSIADDNQSLSGAEMSGFQATKVQVTKVTHINTSQDKKSGHKIDSILERDSSVVHKYQVQTKSTIEMQTTFNSSNGAAIGNVTTLTAPQQTAPTVGGPQVQVHIAGAPTQVVSAPILSSNSGQPTYFNFPGAAPIVQLHNQYQAMASSAPNLNPMSIINLSEPYPTHYSSAFSVPHFATHTHPTPTPFNYFHPGLYQPAGPLLQPFHDSCLIHKPIPFHPPTPQVSHVHNSPQFPNPTLQTHNSQTFPNEMTQPFLPNTQFFHQFPNPIRSSQAVFFQAMPQTSSSMAPNGTTFTLLNPGVHYAHPTVINSEQFATNENPILSENTTFLSPNSSSKLIANTNPSVALNSSNDNSRQHISKSIQCSPQSRDQFQTLSENQFCDSTNSSVRMSQSVSKTPVVTVGPQMSKKINKSDNKSEKRKKSLLLKPSQNRKTEDVVIVHNNVSQSQVARHESPMSSVKSLKNALTPSNKTNSINKSSSQQKNTKNVCFQINTALPSVSERSELSEPLTPTPSPRLMPSRKQMRKRNSHGWSWEGIPIDRYVYLNNEEQSYLRKCYPSIRHNEGDVIRVRDCVLLRSGPRKTDLPFVAKISALWESPEGEMMMSLLWYYRPEHTDLEYYSSQLLGEIFASKHRDTNSVACIDDKCYVLTYNEFCRYKRSKLVKQSPFSTSLTSTTVPILDEPYPRADRLPPSRVFPELVFCCRKVYDYRQKRILKNPI